KIVMMTDFELAKDKVLMGAERKSMVITNEEKRVTAYHEAGHTLVGLKVPNADPVHKVTIIPRGMALGVTQQLPEGDRHNFSKETAIKIDQEVKKIIQDQYERAKQIIEDNRDTMIRLSETLLERETLDGVQIRRIVAGLPVDDDGPPAAKGDEERPQLKEPSPSPLKPILPPITGPATA